MNKARIFTALLIASGLLGSAPSRAQDQAEGRKLYASYCASCHGDKGKGDGVAGKSLPAKPADHTNGAVMNQLTDKFLTEVIAKGGAAVGKSAFMPAWSGALNEKQIRDLLAFIRSLAVPAYKTEGAPNK
jgi:mono/diheme cytochrome c family protein